MDRTTESIYHESLVLFAEDVLPGKVQRLNDKLPQPL